MRIEKSITEASIEGFNSILGTVEEQISELEEGSVENFQFKRQKKKMIGNTGKSVRDICEMVRWSNMRNWSLRGGRSHV